ncbi:MAG: hypothetical protein ACON5P_03060 [Candidatus Puniceispirillaceae bacterium]
MFAGEILIWPGAALLATNFQAAAREALDSKWATQTGQRSTETASLIGGDLSALQNADFDHLES